MFATAGMASPAAHGGTAGAALWDVLRKEVRPLARCFLPRCRCATRV
jgi:hypothetical protein